jgi:hypothetical protein
MSLLFQKSSFCIFVLICFLSTFYCTKYPTMSKTGMIEGQVTNTLGDTLIVGANITTWTAPLRSR